MKRSSLVLQLGLLAAIGCQGQPAPVSEIAPESPPSVGSEEGATAVTLVSLKVPNML